MTATSAPTIGPFVLHTAEVQQRVGRKYVVWFVCELHMNGELVHITKRAFTRSQALEDGEIAARQLTGMLT